MNRLTATGSMVWSLLLMLAIASGSDAQSNTGNGELKRPIRPFVGSREEALKLFLNSEQPLRSRYSAGLRLTEPTENESLQLLAFASDAENPDQLRLLAIAVHRDQERVADTIFQLLNNSQDEDPDFVASLVDTISRWFFVDPTSRVARDAVQALRHRLNDDRPDIRMHVFERLAALNDSMAVDLLVRQVDGKSEPQIPDANAIAFLRRADARQHVGTFKRRFDAERSKDEPNSEVLSELVRGMAVDPAQHDEILRLVSSPSIKPDVAVAGLKSVAFYRGKGLSDVALKLLADNDRDIAVRREAMRSVQRYINRGSDEEKAKLAVPLAEAVDLFLDATKNHPKEQTDASKLRSQLRKNFPSVRQYDLQRKPN